jgi:signal transduction histidine kinase
MLKKNHFKLKNIDNQILKSNNSKLWSIPSVFKIKIKEKRKANIYNFFLIIIIKDYFINKLFFVFLPLHTLFFISINFNKIQINKLQKYILEFPNLKNLELIWQRLEVKFKSLAITNYFLPLC